MINKEYYIICDESDKKGDYYSNFYGGVMIGSSEFDKINQAVLRKKNELNLFGEVKWTKVTERYLDKYISLIDFFFQFICERKLKVRIMFTQNRYIVQNISHAKKENEYFLLYYQFIKNAFDLRFFPEEDYGADLRLYFDTFPQNKEKISKFRQFILRLQNQDIFKYLVSCH